MIVVIRVYFRMFILICRTKGDIRGSGRPIPPLVSEIQVATTNAGTRAQGGLTPDFLALSLYPAGGAGQLEVGREAAVLLRRN
jgi:hypothetical protein